MIVLLRKYTVSLNLEIEYQYIRKQNS